MDKSEHSTTRRFVAILALSLVAFSLLNVIVLSCMAVPSLDKSMQRGVRFLLTGLIAYCLWRGARWARWLSVVLAAVAVISAFQVLASPPESVPVLFRVWIVVMGVFYLVFGLALVIPSRITRYFTSESLA